MAFDSYDIIAETPYDFQLGGVLYSIPPMTDEEYTQVVKKRQEITATMMASEDELEQIDAAWDLLKLLTRGETTREKVKGRVTLAILYKLNEKLAIFHGGANPGEPKSMESTPKNVKGGQ